MFVAVGQHVAPGTTNNWQGVELLPKTTEPRLRKERTAALTDLEAAATTGIKH